MTDKEKVRTELKEKLEELDYSSSLRLTLIMAIEYIDSLPEEHVSEDLEESIDEYYENENGEIVSNKLIIVKQCNV
jgi:hypothetical protein